MTPERGVVEVGPGGLHAVRLQDPLPGWPEQPVVEEEGRGLVRQAVRDSHPLRSLEDRLRERPERDRRVLGRQLLDRRRVPADVHRYLPCGEEGGLRSVTADNL